VGLAVRVVKVHRGKHCRTEKETRTEEMMPRTIADRFWGKVNKTDTCWLWAGASHENRRGTRYGSMTVSKSRTVAVHRLSYTLAFGEIPAGMFICHRCDTPLCVRPDHLFAASNSENMLDCVAKGRMPGTRKEFCKNGHAMTPENSKPRSGVGGPECRECRRAYDRRRRPRVETLNRR
jgi:HNH endonuclease